MSRAEARHQGAVTVRAAVLTDDESQRYFGASQADHGIQAIWCWACTTPVNPSWSFCRSSPTQSTFRNAELEQLLHAWWRGSANAPIKAAVAEGPHARDHPAEASRGGLRLYTP